MKVSHLEAKMLYYIAQAKDQKLSRHEVMHNLHRHTPAEREACWRALIRAGYVRIAEPVTRAGRPPQVAILNPEGRDLVRELIRDGWMPDFDWETEHE